MSDHRTVAVVRLSAVLAIAGGSLRVGNSFTTHLLAADTLALLYLLTDVLLLAGIAGIWWRRRGRLGVAATTGVVIFAVGTLVIRLSAFGVLGAAGYQIGAAVALLGLAAYSVETLLRHSAARCAPALWLVSLVCAVAGTAGIASPILIGAAGVTFGVGFIVAGVEVLRG